MSHLGPEASLRAALAAIGPADHGEPAVGAEATRYVLWLAQTFQSGGASVKPSWRAANSLAWATREFRWTPRHVERHLLRPQMRNALRI